MKKLTSKPKQYTKIGCLRKIFIVMKLTVFIITITAMELFAVESFSQTAKMNLELEFGKSWGEME